MNVFDQPTIKAVVFDLDGLMLNTEDIFDLAGRELLARRGLEMTHEIHRSMLGRRPDEAFQAMKDLSGITDSIEDLKLETRELFYGFADEHLAVMPGVLSLLDHIDQLGLPRAVATSSPRDYMITMLNRFGLLDGFQQTFTAEDVTHGKPNPEIYLMAAASLELAPEQMLVFEDSETGTKAAAASGAFAVAVPNRHTESGDFSMASLKVGSLGDASIRALFCRDETS
ncbi:MAG: HAD family phosphatase [Fuerstiella sp.]